VVENGRLGRARRAGVVMGADRVQELCSDGGLERRGALLDQAQAKVDVSEQPTLFGGAEGRPTGELDRTSDVVEQRGGEQEIGAQARMELSDLAADRRHADRVLEEPSGVPVVAVDGRGQRPQAPSHGFVLDELRDGCTKALMRDLAGEELKEAIQLVGVAAERRRKLRRVEILGGLEAPHVELELVAETLHASEHAHCVALVEPAVEEIDVAPDSSLDPAARVDELESEVRRPHPSAQPLLLRNRVDALDDPVLLELCDGRHASESRPGNGCYGCRVLPEIRPFRALRYDTGLAGPLEALVAPPYDVIGPEDRDRYLARSPYNVVHLTLPDSEQAAGRSYREWREQGILVPEEEVLWALSQDYVGPDRVSRTRTGLVASLRVEPYEDGAVLPHERTHRGPKEGRLRLLREVRAQLEPIFLLYEGEAPFALPERSADLAVEGAKLWRLDEASPGDYFADKRLLIADGHHRYETALAYHEEAGTPESAYMMVVLVSVLDPGLTIFPTHRLAGSVNGPKPTHSDLEPALRDLESQPRDRAAAVLYRRGGRVSLLRGGGGQLDVELVEEQAPHDVTYTASIEEAVAAVETGSAEGAFLVRPLRVEDVFEAASRGETMPQKSTYFYPKLLSGLLFHPLEP
jgi:uncharacterized protein (DUF1015 family)